MAAGLADEVLQRVGARLNTVLRESDTVGRLGGDEFVMLVDTVGLDVAPELVAERILDVLRQPIEFAEGKRPAVSMTASIGIATGLPASAENLLQDAALALAKAKAQGKDGYLLFESAMHTASRDRMHLEMDLARRSRADQLFMVYQPMVELENEQVVGVEALIRWRHPTRGVIPPDCSCRSLRRPARSCRSAGGRSSRPALRPRPGTRRDFHAEPLGQRLRAAARAGGVRRAGSQGPYVIAASIRERSRSR